jgi:hypothetical protein
MGKKFKIICIIILLIIVGFNGCVENQSDRTNKFAENLAIINENFFISYSNINDFLINYTYKYDWYDIINKTTFSMSLISDMEEFTSKIENQINNIESYIEEYYLLKNDADLKKLNFSQNITKNEVEYKILNFNYNKNIIENCTKNMDSYKYFVYLYILKIIKLEDYGKSFNLLNTKIENEEFEDAKIYLNQIIQIMNELKVIDYYQANLSIKTFDEELLGIWDLYIEAWNVYREYIDLALEGKMIEADSKYDEYTKKFEQVLEISSKENQIADNNEISKWYYENIGNCIELINNST